MTTLEEFVEFLSNIACLEKENARKILKMFFRVPRCPKCFEIMYDDHGKYQCVNENCEVEA